MTLHTKKPIRKLFTLLCMVSFLLLAGSITAHADMLDDLPDPGGDVDVPIDGGLSLLVAAGVGYGMRRIGQHRKAGR